MTTGEGRRPHPTACGGHLPLKGKAFGGETMTRHRYTVYDTGRHEYLERVELPNGDRMGMVTYWTDKVEDALKYQGIKGAQCMLNLLGNYSEFIIKNENGEVVG